MTDRDKRISDQLVRLVQIVFGVVLAQGLILNRDLILDPFSPQHLVGTLALFAIYATTVLSWVDWHITMELRPYNLNPKSAYIRTEYARLCFDLVIVTAYAYLIFVIETFKSRPEAWVGRFVLGFVIIFAAYLLAGLARRIAHGKLATNPVPILCTGLAYVVLYILYGYAYDRAPSTYKSWINFGTIVLVVAIMFAYRSVRARVVSKRQEAKKAGPVVAIDIDGVLADQIDGLLPRIRRRLGIELSYTDITEWRLPLGETTDIAEEINVALEDDHYILSMPVHSGARELVDELYPNTTIDLLTARPARTRVATAQWLSNHGFTFDKLVNATEERKSLHRPDILVDDYIGNIKDYLTETQGVAILVSRPWNALADRDYQLALWVTSGRLYIVSDLQAAKNVLLRLLKVVHTQVSTPETAYQDITVADWPSENA